MRAFWAIELPEQVRAELARAQSELRDRLGPEAAIGWTPPANWHLTLAFLGDVREAEPVVDAVRAAVGVARPGPLELALAGLGTFGDRVLWAGVGGPGRPGLVTVAGEVARACAALGYPADERPYSPHITLGRAREGGRGRSGRDRARGRGRRRAGGRGRAGAGAGADLQGAVREARALAPLTFAAREVVLFESRLGGPHPATYVPHAHVPLA